MDDYSIVEIFDGPTEAHRCGYCKTKGSVSYGMWTHNLTVKDYQALIDRGWRRSGKYCYKPVMQQTCCPLYTIKCSATEFKLSKSHKKILRRMYRFLRYGESKVDRNIEMAPSDQNFGGDQSHQEMLDVTNLQTRASIAEDNLDDKRIEKQLRMSTNNSIQTPSPNLDSAPLLNAMPASLGSTSSTTEANPTEMRKEPTSGKGPDPKRPQCKKAKLVRMEKRLQKLDKNSMEMATPMQATSVKVGPKNVVKTLQDHLSEALPPDAVHKLEIKLVRSEPPSAEYQQTFDESYAVYKMYQMTIHNDQPDRCSSAQFTRFLVNSPLEVKFVRCWPRSPEFKSTMEESYNVYALYQRCIHQETDEDFDKNTYFDFLVNSPLEPVEATAPSHPGYGSFHQQYWLDGVLIAVGVMDILPCCISSVYFYYNPKYSFLSLGTYGALREIAFTQQLNNMAPELQFYYMGFYIHSCQKMRYKGQYYPSMLLCPEAYTWHPIEEAIQKLNEQKYCRLEDRDMGDEDGKVDLNDVMVLYRRTALPYYIYTSLKRDQSPREPEEILNYAKLVGKKCIGKLLLYRK